MLGTAQDVTEQRQAERLRDDILSAVSHELRTPPHLGLGFALTLEGRRDDLSARSRLARGELAGAARRLERLLADLLDVERVRRGVVDVKRTRTDVLELVERAVTASRLDGRQVDISGAPVIADGRAEVERIVENLVLNAAKHTPERAAIHVRLDTQGADLLLSVDDEGRGSPTTKRRLRDLQPRAEDALDDAWASESAWRWSRASPRCTAAARGSRTATGEGLLPRPPP